ncbi:hypothetical protein P43SY_002690 [Pythium insidiosum]|uniref:Long-chain-fatty-acid--CoA ligase n=1 Tax=Pythium insidiosum TaxID=114742 RepID=A0AAD5MCE3_PYTIN|nr:hypothetical protein P43SY_002690 [Pythium insidiosum]
MTSITSVGYSKVLAGTETPNHTAIHRSTIPSSNPLPGDRSDPATPLAGLTCSSIESAFHNFVSTAKRHADAQCLGVQRIVGDVAEPFEWLTYGQVMARIEHLGAGMMLHDLLPVVDRQRILAVYMRNSIDWIVAEYAGFAFGCCVVALYDTLGCDSTEYILNQTELPTVVCTEAELKRLLTIRTKCPRLQNVVLSGAVDPVLEKQATDVGLRVYTIADLEIEGKLNPRPLQPPKPSDLATIMYTSGTTGDPKGVMLTHASLLASAQSTTEFLQHFGVTMGTHSTYLSYLPLAHIFERCAHINMYRHGAHIGFWRGNPLKLVDDLRALRPTLFCTVPRLLNRIHDMVMARVSDAPKLRKFLFHKALSTKVHRLHKHGKTRHGWWDKLVFNKLAAGLGLDRCELMISGSAPLSPAVLAFCRVAFPGQFVEGYGQTETCSLITTMHLTDLSGGYVGGPSSCAEVRLEAVPDMGYLPTDREHGDERVPCVGRGEICVRGPHICTGYYKLPDKTAEAIDAEGWLHTGDIGMWSPLGQLKIIDRKKNIFKLSQGEYVAPEKIENVLQSCPSIAQVFVTGDSFHSHLVGIVVPEEMVFRKMAAANGISIASSLKELCDQPLLKKLVHAEMEAASTRSRLAGFERVKQIYLHHELFTVDNDLLTPTFKLKRADAQRYFKKQIEQLYQQSGDAVAGMQITQQ